MLERHKNEPQKVINYINTQITTGTLVTEALDIMEAEARADTTKQILETSQEIEYCEYCGHKIRLEWTHNTTRRMSECAVKLQHYNCECNEAKPKSNLR